MNFSCADIPVAHMAVESWSSQKLTAARQSMESNRSIHDFCIAAPHRGSCYYTVEEKISEGYSVGGKGNRLTAAFMRTQLEMDWNGTGRDAVLHSTS